MSNCVVFTSVKYAIVRQTNCNILQYVSKTLLRVQGSNRLICNPYHLCASPVSFQWKTDATTKPIWPQIVSIPCRRYAETTPKDANEKEDLKTSLRFDPQETFFPYQDLEELKNAPETVQRLCTLAFADRNQRKFHKINETKKKIEEVLGVRYGREMIIANMTLQIRAIIPHLEKNKKDIRSKVFLYEKLAKRKKELRRLRKEDYVSFIWLLKLLQIKYIPPKPYTSGESKFAKQKREAREAVFELRHRKLEELREKMAEERKEFLKHKEKVLADVAEKMEKYRLKKKDILKAVENERKAKLQNMK